MDRTLVQTDPSRADAVMRPQPADQLIVALDFPSASAALDLADQLQGLCRWFKVGMELYYAAGNQVLDRLQERGFNVFLDLKLHDIPNTVAGAVRSVAGTGWPGRARGGGSPPWASCSWRRPSSERRGPVACGL